MAEFAKDSFDVPSCAKQPEGLKKSAPKWGFGTSKRSQAQKVYISKSHSADVLGMDSPGPLYEYSKDSTKCYAFGRAPRPGLNADSASYPPTSNDLLQIHQPLPDEYKHCKAARTKFGTSLRAAAVNAPGLEGYGPGGISPGPAHYTSNFGSANKMPPSYTMSAKVKTGASKYEVRPGPQAYMLPGGLGAQPNARKPSLPNFSFGKAPRFKTRQEAVSMAPPGGDHDGQLRLKFQRCANRAATWKLGTSTRDQQRRLAPALLPEDTITKKGPGGLKVPDALIPPRKHVLKYTEI
ncbi:unnamed protein product [Amoebophrya sp. A25]|nr:unnamed protein product [Amoebophrya sp. A25]|eukprot:GSA25T00023338001.1